VIEYRVKIDNGREDNGKTSPHDLFPRHCEIRFQYV